MIYCFSKMTLKIILFITILSSFGNYKGVKCTNSALEAYIAVDGENIDLHHRRCLLALYITMYQMPYTHEKGTPYITTLTTIEDYYQRLLRFCDNNSVYLKQFNTEIWSFYVEFKRWNSLDHDSNERINSEGKIHSRAKELINLGNFNGLWCSVATEGNIYNYTKNITRDFKYCKRSLEFLTEKTINVHKEIDKLLLEKDSKISELIQRFEILTRFRYIICLINDEGDFNAFMSKENKSEQKLILIKIMITTLHRIFDGVIAILSVIDVHAMSRDKFNTLINSDTEVGNQLTIMKKIYLNAIEANKAIYTINEKLYLEHSLIPQHGRPKRKIGDVYNVNSPSGYMGFIEYFQSKFDSLCPNCFNRTIKTNSKRLKKEYDDVNSRDPYRFFTFVRRSGNLKINTEFRVNPEIIGFFNTCFSCGYEKPVEINSNNLKTLLEINLWLVIFRINANDLRDQSSSLRNSSLGQEGHETFFGV